MELWGGRVEIDDPAAGLWGNPMEVDDLAFPLTRAQLDIWLAQETGLSSVEWQLGLFVRIDGVVQRGSLEWAIRRVVQESEPARAAFFEVEGRVFQRAVEYPDVDLAFYDLSDSDQPVQEAREKALSIQRTPMPLTGPLFKFALFKTRADEFYLLACAHHIAIDGTGVVLVGQRIASVYWRLFPARRYRQGYLARCRTWSTANWRTRNPTITATTRRTGRRIFLPKAPVITGSTKRPVSVIRGRRHPCSLIPRWWPGSKSWRGNGTSREAR